LFPPFDNPHYHRDNLKQKLDVPVSDLFFATETPTIKWQWRKFKNNREKKVIQVGWWLRKLHFIHQLETSKFKKVFLKINRSELLADLMKNTGVLMALDVKKRRLRALANHLERCHIRNTVVYGIDARQVSQFKLKFDRILVDAPCSGNFAADPNWFKRRTLKDVERNARLQREILAEVAACLKDDGELVYSTCSLEPEENEANMDWAVKHLNLRIEEIDCYGRKGLTEVFGRRLDMSVERCRRIWPAETQGFFVCKLKNGGEKH